MGDKFTPDNLKTLFSVLSKALDPNCSDVELLEWTEKLQKEQDNELPNNDGKVE